MVSAACTKEKKMRKRLFTALAIILFIAPFFNPASAGSEDHLLVEDLMDANWGAIAIQAWSPNITSGKIDPDSAWFATLKWTGTSLEDTCDMLVVPAGTNYLVWNTITQNNSGAYWLDASVGPLYGTAEKNISIRSCWAYFSRHAIPEYLRSNTRTTDQNLLLEHIQSMCGSTCTTIMDIDPVTVNVIRVIPYTENASECPSWTLSGSTVGVYAKPTADNWLTWESGTFFKKPTQPHTCAILWFFSEPRG